MGWFGLTGFQDTLLKEGYTCSSPRGTQKGEIYVHIRSAVLYSGAMTGFLA